MRSANILTIGLGLALCSTGTVAQSVFNGTWRPDPQRPDPNRQPEVYLLSAGQYSCQSCMPPYSVQTDGAQHAVSGNIRFDSMAVSVIDAHTVKKIAERSGQQVVDDSMTVSADGKSLTERQVSNDTGPRPVDFTIRFSRVAAGPAGAHLISGSWHLIEADLTNHDEDTTYRVKGDTLSMTDHLGRSFTARLDGTEAPYNGSPEINRVTVRLIDPRTIEETDKKDAQVVMIARWSIEPDGKTMHVKFDTTRGPVMTQTGHKIQ
ncbi:MAG TPA: hypothetical protein VLW26_00055 [Steroidobacteraceae bacterium]|nr:hypothetical protein [Steroidobacteraceae bacterium]